MYSIYYSICVEPDMMMNDFYNDNQISGQTKKEANLRHVQWAPRDMPRVWVGATSLYMYVRGKSLFPYYSYTQNVLL